MEGSRRSVARISAEFLLIVLGVLVALAVDRWSESRADRELEVMYLERLRGDMIGSRSDLQIPYYEGVEAHSRAALPYVAREQELSDSVGLVIAAYHAHRMLTPRVRRRRLESVRQGSAAVRESRGPVSSTSGRSSPALSTCPELL